MKPIKLTMTAFGPYKYTETIDFQELEQNHLFVISGNTGAGKTTIFDGISFALYGSASGSDRENTAMLRSDFAEDDTHTAVELVFELHQRTYRILRQLGHVKQGNKTKTGEKYEFYEIVDGTEIPCVDRQIVSEIDKKVEEIIGLTKDQFKQIVMLPQGEFRKLLTSETENKEEILRRIFKTESYKQIGELLKQKKSIVKQEFDQLKQTRDNQIQNIFAVLPERKDSHLFQVLSEEHFNVNQIISGLEKEVFFYREKIDLDQKKYDEAYKQHDKQQNIYYQTKAVNDRFIELDQKKVKLKELEEKIPSMEKQEKQLADAERASGIEIYEKQAAEWKKEEKQKLLLLQNAQINKKQSDEQFKNAEAAYNEEEKKKDIREKISKKLDRLHEFLPMVQDIDQMKKQLQVLRNKANQAYSDLEQVQADWKDKNQTADEKSKNIKLLEEATSHLPSKQQKLHEMREQARVLRDYINLTKEITIKQEEMKQKKQAFQQLKDTYREKEALWMNNQASMLAAHLHDGEACPVCGSLDHPKKAAENGQITTRDELDRLKVRLDELESSYRNALAILETKTTNQKEKAEELAELNVPVTDAFAVNEQLIADGKRLGTEVEQLNKQHEQLRKLRVAYDREVTLIKQLESKKELLDKAFQEQKTSYETTKARYEERVSKIPESVQDLTILEKEIHETVELYKRLEKNWENAQKLLEKAKEENTKAATNLENKEQQLNETQTRREKAEIAFESQLSDAKFTSVDLYHQAKIPLTEREKMKAAIQGFKENLSSLKQQVMELELTLKNKERVDLTVLEQKLVELKSGYESALQQLNLSKEYYQESAKMITKIIEVNEQVANYEKQLGTITDLYDVIRGQNDSRISFERYLQIEYLERIIEAANQRLKRLSNGQFYLIRSDRQESHGKQSGLGLDVYDTYTGQTRDVKTLSGGEKFNASLCLALGMSDVIQSFQGNISIETMFIDEGFGSLDEEALNKAIDTLIELQQTGRMIGVISHVQDLKNMFPAILEVAKTKEGYSSTKIVVK
ncbi:AAA family ATPase [Oceanobacillus halophilus]|uniref:Nuclease SbcCD subunit C n=1 Tax=Oceanobacillus halophilus TaxID=930130 RepID=A0A494ZWG0_9BACI|nr:SMC family ATPase [Oceanobacillus halophilus]RKQ30776.1 SMC family ATPase [Oceanobacillus halophilus]